MITTEHELLVRNKVQVITVITRKRKRNECEKVVKIVRPKATYTYSNHGIDQADFSHWINHSL